MENSSNQKKRKQNPIPLNLTEREAYAVSFLNLLNARKNPKTVMQSARLKFFTAKENKFILPLSQYTDENNGKFLEYSMFQFPNDTKPKPVYTICQYRNGERKFSFIISAGQIQLLSRAIENEGDICQQQLKQNAPESQ